MSVDNAIFWSAVFVAVLSIVLIKGGEWLDKHQAEKDRKKDTAKHSDV
jgi:hypothetical protein